MPPFHFRHYCHFAYWYFAFYFASVLPDFFFIIVFFITTLTFFIFILRLSFSPTLPHWFLRLSLPQILSIFSEAAGFLPGQSLSMVIFAEAFSPPPRLASFSSWGRASRYGPLLIFIFITDISSLYFLIAFFHFDIGFHFWWLSSSFFIHLIFSFSSAFISPLRIFRYILAFIAFFHWIVIFLHTLIFDRYILRFFHFITLPLSFLFFDFHISSLLPLIHIIISWYFLLLRYWYFRFLQSFSFAIFSFIAFISQYTLLTLYFHFDFSHFLHYCFHFHCHFLLLHFDYYCHIIFITHAIDISHTLLHYHFHWLVTDFTNTFIFITVIFSSLNITDFHFHIISLFLSAFLHFFIFTLLSYFQRHIHYYFAIALPPPTPYFAIVFAIAFGSRCIAPPLIFLRISILHFRASSLSAILPCRRYRLAHSSFSLFRVSPPIDNISIRYFTLLSPVSAYQIICHYYFDYFISSASFSLTLFHFAPSFILAHWYFRAIFFAIISPLSFHIVSFHFRWFSSFSPFRWLLRFFLRWLRFSLYYVQTAFILIAIFIFFHCFITFDYFR